MGRQAQGSSRCTACGTTLWDCDQRRLLGCCNGCSHPSNTPGVECRQGFFGLVFRDKPRRGGR